MSDKALIHACRSELWRIPKKRFEILGFMVWDSGLRLKGFFRLQQKAVKALGF